MHRFHPLKGLVVQNLDVEILASTHLMELNDISVWPAKKHAILHDGTIYVYEAQQSASSCHSVHRAQVLHAPNIHTTVLPDEYAEVDLQDKLASGWDLCD